VVREKQIELKQARRSAHAAETATSNIAVRANTDAGAGTARSGAETIVPGDEESPEPQHEIERDLQSGQVRDFAGRRDVYVGGKLVRQVELGATKDQTGEYKEKAVANLRVVYDPSGRGKQVYMRGKIAIWTKNNQGAFFELALREVDRLPVKEVDVLVLDK
jgi:hypothetical protein